MTAPATREPVSPPKEKESWRAISARMRSEEAVFVVGVPRSGTTALRHTLDQHPSFRACKDKSPETRVFASPSRVEHILAETAKPAFRYLLEDEQTAANLLADVAGMRLPGGSLRRLASNALAQAQREDNWVAAARWRLLGRSHLIRLYFHHAKQIRGVQRILEKTPHHVFFIDEIFAAFPRARVLVSVRHPVDVYSSFRKRLERDRRAGRDEQRLRWLAEDVKKFAKRYQRIANAAFAQVDQRPGRLHVVRYEDLTSSPQDTLTQICEFIGERFDAEVLLGELEVERDEFGSPTPQKRIVSNEKKWDEFLSLKEAQALEARLSPVLKRLGYVRYTTDGPSEGSGSA